jgi:hypothetical protein
VAHRHTSLKQLGPDGLDDFRITEIGNMQDQELTFQEAERLGVFVIQLAKMRCV